jgi:hypothetical protein
MIEKKIVLFHSSLPDKPATLVLVVEQIKMAAAYNSLQSIEGLRLGEDF